MDPKEMEELCGEAGTCAEGGASETGGGNDEEGPIGEEGDIQEEGTVEEGVTGRANGMAEVEELEVVYGRGSLSGWCAFLFGEHWAVKVGEWWYEVGPEPDNTTGHIITHLACFGASKTDVVGQYSIVKSEGANSANGAMPAPVAYSPTNFFWLLGLCGILFVARLGFAWLWMDSSSMTNLDVIFILIELLGVFFLAALLGLLLGAALGRGIKRCLRREDERARQCGAMVALIVGYGSAALGGEGVLYLNSLTDPDRQIDTVQMLVFLLMFCHLGLLVIELGAPIGWAVGRGLRLGEAGVQRCGVLGALLTAIGGEILAWVSFFGFGFLVSGVSSKILVTIDFCFIVNLVVLIVLVLRFLWRARVILVSWWSAYRRWV